MKKIFTILTLALGISAATTAQTIDAHYFNTTYFKPCEAPTNGIVPPIGSVPGLSPSDSALPCGQRGTYISDTIYFHNFHEFSGLVVNYLTIDSIYLPSGLCWSTNKASNSFTHDEDGVILVQGTTLAPAGQYKLRIIIDAGAGPNGTNTFVVSKADAEALANLRYRVRIICPDTACPALNKTDTVDAYIPYANQTCPTAAINEVANDVTNLSIVPNPFSRTATMTFTSEIEGTYTLRMTNILGSVVSAKEVHIVNGSNQLAIDRNGLSSGMYLISISNGRSAVTRKVVIE
jgi:hypothetical protein